MKQILPILLAFAVAVSLLPGCYKEPDWVGDHIKTENKHYPVISGFRVVDKKDAYAQGDQVTVDLDFWSVDPIKEIQFYFVKPDTVLAGSSPYIENFKEDSQTDELVMSFTVPVVQDTTDVVIDALIINENGLTRRSGSGTGNRPSVSITVLP